MPSIAKDNKNNPSETGAAANSNVVELHPPIDSASEDEGETPLQTTVDIKNIAKLKKKQDEEFKNKLNHVRNNPALWEHPDNQYLREFCNYVESNRRQFPCVPGDDCFDQVVGVRNAQKQLTKGYVKAIAEFRDTTFVDHPTLYVLGRTVKHENQTFSGFSDRQPPPVQTTHVRLVDGDGNHITGRLSTETAGKGKELKRSDIIRLDLFTELTHRINEKTDQMPWLFVLKYTPIGYSSVPPVCVEKDPIPCSNTLPQQSWAPKQSTSADRSDEEVNCCTLSRFCSMHGVSFVCCVCETIPMDKLDLVSIRENCYFATDQLDKMSNPHKRNMIYWWYATNVYSICGKGKRKQLPKCLVHRIRQCYPSEEYSGFELSSGLQNQYH